MGGLGSGRRRTHANIADCLVIDARDLRKSKLLTITEPVTLEIRWRKTMHTNFVKTKETQHNAGATFTPGEHPTLSVYYNLDVTNTQTGEKKTIPRYSTIYLVSTPCNYGGVRWWFACPGCQRRVQALYINTKKGTKPECRHCLDLNYGTQIASYIERHKTYERYLLANYGYQWAEHRYEWEMKEHYLSMTPELEALKQKSIYEWNTQMLLHLVRSDLAIYRCHLKILKSLKSREDRQTYWKHMTRRDKDRYSLSLVGLLEDSIKTEQLARNVNIKSMPESLVSTYKSLVRAKTDTETAQIKATERKIISLGTILKELSRQEKKAA